VFVNAIECSQVLLLTPGEEPLEVPVRDRSLVSPREMPGQELYTPNQSPAARSIRVGPVADGRSCPQKRSTAHRRYPAGPPVRLREADSLALGGRGAGFRNPVATDSGCDIPQPGFLLVKVRGSGPLFFT